MVSRHFYYLIEFIHVNTFEYLVKTILLFSERVFKSTGAKQVICKLKLDKNDKISTEFIKLID